MSLAPRFTPSASLTPAVREPDFVRLAAERARLAYEVAVVYAEAGIAVDVPWPYQVQQLAAGHPRVDVFEHGVEARTLAGVLVFPPPLLQADERRLG